MTTRPEAPLTIYLIAGEPSGDALGARLMAALTEQAAGNVTFLGIGGSQMTEQGLESLFPMKHLAVMGLTEVLPHIPKFLRLIKETARHISETRPDIVITIDAPAFTNRVAKKVKREAADPPPLVHYVAPTVWAWKPGRAAKLARIYDHLMVLLPFEPPYFEKEGLATTFVGHSVIEGGQSFPDKNEARADLGVASDKRVMALLPGSRMGEVYRHMPVMKAVCQDLHQNVPDITFLVPTVETVEQAVRHEMNGWDLPVQVLSGETAKRQIFGSADFALAASGTVTLELALARVPTVVMYQLSPISAWLARKLVKAKYASIVNLLHDREVLPELLLEDCTAEKITPALRTLVSDPDYGEHQKRDMLEAMSLLGAGETLPSARAAACVLSILTSKETPNV